MRKARILAILAALVVTLLAPVTMVSAQSGSGDVIKAIKIDGTARIEQETVRSYLLLQVGDPFNRQRMDQSLKALFRTGLFSDVAVARSGNTLLVRVVENPIINRIAFEGNSKLEDDDIRKELQLRPRVVYTRTKVQADTKRILDMYRSVGRFAATVEPKVIPLDQNRVDLVFEINEGKTTGIQRISFIGNDAFSDTDLESVVSTKETVWWNFLTSRDIYDPDRLTFDQELLRKFYLSKGYADFRNVSVVAELAPDRSDFFVTFTVEEGERYKFGALDVTSNLRDVNVDELKLVVADLMKEGDWYNGDLVEKAINRLIDRLGTFGYAFVEVRPIIKRNREELTVEITFDIQEGPKVFVERINIIGNTRTRDEVIRREMRLAEGDAFNTTRIQDSKRRIDRLGFFEKVTITNVPGSSPDKTIINVEVEEKPTGELTLGAGFSSAEGAIGNIGLRERNFLGRGQEIGASIGLSQRTQQFDLSFTEPYFQDRPLSVGGDLFRVTSDFSDEGGFDRTRTGFRLRMGYDITDDLRQSWSYGYRIDKIDDIETGASGFIQQEQGSSSVSSIAQTLTLDRRDDVRNTTSGYIATFGMELAGIGGSERFVKPTLKGRYWYPFAEDWVASLGGELGTVRGLGKDVGLSERFFIGQSHLRGFEVGGIGPRARNTGDALGANTYYAINAELSFPTGLPKDFGIKGYVFTDIGSAFGIDGASGTNLQDEASIRVSAGVGVSWESPFGPIRIDFGVPLVKEDFDEEELIRLNFGTRF